MNKHIQKILIAVLFIVSVSGNLFAQEYIDGKKDGSHSCKNECYSSGWF